MGLLYGGDDFWKVCEIATRCGQDSDCNPASAAGVWGCMHGLSRLPADAGAGIERIADRPFSHTRYRFRTLIDACRRVSERLIERTGGSITPGAYRIPLQQPAPAPLEQWENQSGKP